MSICLNMIVKNESEIIVDTLTRLVSKIKLNYYVICDTGSTDDTKILIETFFKDIGITGEIYSNVWKDFGYNRTLALEYAFNKCDYLFIFDADDSIEGNLILPELTFDSYMLKFGNESNSYERMCLVKSNIVWKYVGVLHEYITSDLPFSKGYLSGNYYIVSGRTSSRNKDPNKYINDAMILEKAYYLAVSEKNSISNRYVYYCANSYCDAGVYNKAIEWYKLTLESFGWFDERYNSCLKLFELTKNEDYLVRSFHFNPNRIEGIYRLIQKYCCNAEYSIAWNYYRWIQDYYENNYSYNELSTKLFAKTLEYTFYLPYYMIIVSENMKMYETGNKMYSIIFSRMEDTLIAGKWWINNLIFNVQFFKDVKFEKYLIFLKNNNIFVESMKKYNTDTILFYTGFSNELWNISYTKTNALGGSEKAIIYLAKELSQKYKIIITGDVLEENIDNISFVHRFSIQDKKIHFKYIIVSRYVSFFTMFPNFTADKLILMAHDTHFMNNLINCKLTEKEIIDSNLNKIDCCVCLTKWQKTEYQKLYPNLKYVIINNGIPIDLFPQKKYKVKSSFIYTSGSVRGLKRLLELWPEITQLLPDSTLNIASYENFPNNELDNELEKVINTFGNVFHLGKLNQQKLYTLMDKTEFWLYPCSFNETSCITAMEMMMSEVICLYYPIAGLTDTMNGHGIQITEGNEITSLKNKLADLKLAKDYAITCSWKNRAQEWELLLNNKGEIKIINLERRKDRKNSMIDGLKLNGISNYNFVEAIDGLTLNSSKEIQEQFKNNNHNYHKGVIGCTLSHIKVWKQLINDPLNDYYVILEDDLIFTDNFKNKLNRAIELSKGLPFLSIGCFDIPVENKEPGNLKTIKQECPLWTGGTHGYIIYKDTCIQLLKNKNSLKQAIDFEIANCLNSSIYFLNEYIVKQKSFEDTDIQRHSECFHFANELPKKMVFYYNKSFNIILLDDYFNSLKTKYDIIVTDDLSNLKYIDEIIFVHNLFDPSVFELNCTISYLNTEPLNLGCRLNYILYNLNNVYPKIKTYYDYSLSNIQILHDNSILNTFHLEYLYEPMEIQFLKEQLVQKKEYDFGIMCSGSVPTNDPAILTPPRRKKVVEYLLEQGFTINIISGWGKLRDIELGKCKTILNIHGQYSEEPSTIFEHIRCNRLLYAGFQVLSETSLNFNHSFTTLKFIPYNSFFNLSKKSKVIDCFIFYNEVELLDYRLNILKNVVNTTIIVEATTTFTGKPKKMYFDKSKYKDFNIIHIVVDLPHTDISDGQQWKNEEYQRNCIERGFKDLSPDDFIIISDVDEIPDPGTLNLIKLESNLEVLSQFEQDFYYYNLKNKLTDLWYSCKIFKYKLLNTTIQDIRLQVLYGIYPGGWHLSYFGTPEFISNKIQNFGHQEFNNPEFTNLNKIQNKIKNGIDIFDRNIKIEHIPYELNTYLPPGYLKLDYLKPKNYCFIHSCNVNGDISRLQHLLKSIKLINFEKIFINNIGQNLELDIPTIQHSDNILEYEIPTIHLLHEFSKKNSGNILYLHTKGTGHSKDAQNINDWIDMMLFFLVEQWPVALHELESCDTVGCNYHNQDSSRAPPHFSGNFWWAKTDYLAKLPKCGPNKFDAEFWLHLENPKFKCLHDTGGMNHYFNEYPSKNYR
jgi:GR25 family glycosyltransferase involved in LPS biosynthesis